MIEPIMMQISTSGPRDKGMKLLMLGVKRSRSHKATDRFRGLEEAYFSNPFG